MLFSSIGFLYWFLPIVLILYFVVPFRFKNLVLLLSSLGFYFYGEKAYTLIMLFAILASYIMGLLTDKCRGTKWAKICLGISVCISLGLLGFYKYADFVVENINTLFSVQIPLFHVILPIGISFYTFQILSYNIDVYRGKVPVQKNIWKLATYISLFPQLIAGPIVWYETVEKELSERTHSFENFSVGVQRFVMGLSQKVLIANVLGELCNVFREAEEKTLLFYWIYAVAFSLHIFFDFAGYSDMAIGLGRMFGFHFLENFDYPYISKSITEFWRRWHISLGSWFRDYVYIPMGGNRVSRPRWLFNLLVVWFLTGLWHGSSWNFVIWGLYFGVLLIIEKLCFNKVLQKLPKAVCHIYVLVLVAISFVLFNAADTTQMWQDLGGLFGYGITSFSDAVTLYYLRSYGVVLIVAMLLSTPVVKVIVGKLQKSQRGAMVVDVATPILVACGMILCTAYLVDGSFNPFLYFRF